jgi:CheY-like chemotaxis protein
MRALVADDDRVTTVVLGRALEKLGVEIVVARDGLEAWALLQAGGITITILDLQLLQERAQRSGLLGAGRAIRVGPHERAV